MAKQDARFWDEWWRDRLSKDTSELFPIMPAPISRFGERWVDFANRDDVLVDVMAEHGLRTVLCAGNGVSQEPRALAASGLDVTALEISPVAVRFAEDARDDSRGLGHLCSPQLRRPGGRVQFVVGDLLDRDVCPGPFDVVIERRTVQHFAGEERDAALAALSARLGKMGIFMSLCFDDPFPPDLGWTQHESGLFHASESWFRAHGWTIWDERPDATLTGRVAWLIRCGTMKPPPGDKRVE